MQHIITILIAILIFGLIIGIHEFGHFIVAKLNHIQVNQFAIGMGPKLIHFQKGETEYSLRLFPIGGFCAMEGEDQSSDNPNAFEKKAVWRRMTVVLAGAFMNLVLGFLLIAILLCTAQKAYGQGRSLRAQCHHLCRQRHSGNCQADLDVID